MRDVVDSRRNVLRMQNSVLYISRGFICLVKNVVAIPLCLFLRLLVGMSHMQHYMVRAISISGYLRVDLLLCSGGHRLANLALHKTEK